jgi:hypothetical protein
MKRLNLVAVFALVIGLLGSQAARGGDCCAPAAAVSSGPQYVTKTICVPEMVTEERDVTVTECAAVTRTCKVPCCVAVPVTKTVRCCCIVMEPHQCMRTECYREAIPETRQVTETFNIMVPTTRTIPSSYTVCVPVYSEQTEQCTVMVPSCETRQGVRCETHCVPVKQTCMRCIDKGHWEDKPVPACGPCQPAQTVRCWASNWVQEPVEVTVNKLETVEAPYTYQVTVCKPVVQTHKVQVCHYENQVRPSTRTICEYHCQPCTHTYAITECKFVERTRQVPYTVCVPRTEYRDQQITTCEMRPSEREVQYTEMVPHQVQKKVQVQVCHMVEKTIQVPVCQPCCQPCCPTRCYRMPRCGCGC